LNIINLNIIDMDKFDNGHNYVIFLKQQSKINSCVQEIENEFTRFEKYLNELNDFCDSKNVIHDYKNISNIHDRELLY
jgi:hypothetical protein